MEDVKVGNEVQEVISKIEKMPPQEKAKISMMAYVEPIPPSSELEKYEEIKEGLADRIVAMAEKSQIHVSLMEKQSQDRMDRLQVSHSILSHRAQNYSFVLAISFLLSATLLSFYDKWIPATLIGLTGLSLLMASFWKFRDVLPKSQEKERQQIVKPSTSKPSSRKRK